jgi:hypothetical protein
MTVKFTAHVKLHITSDKLRDPLFRGPMASRPAGTISQLLTGRNKI